MRCNSALLFHPAIKSPQLGDCVLPEVVAPLIGCLMDEDPSLGRLVDSDPELQGLANILGPIATQLRAGNTEIRLACARTLGTLKHRVAVPALLAALEDADTLVVSRASSH